MGLEEEVNGIPHNPSCPTMLPEKAIKIVGREEINNFWSRELTPKEQ